jgi:3-oxoacyl-[acyl-carrier-protein] synthase II
VVGERHIVDVESVVITGLGLVSALGSEPGACFEALLAGQSGVSEVPEALRGEQGLRAAGLLPDFDCSATLGKRAARRVPRVVVLAIEAARRARADAGLSDAPAQPGRVATIIGTAFGGVEQAHLASSAFRKSGFQGVTPFHLTGMIGNMPAGMVAIEAGAKGPSFAISDGTTASASAIGRAFHLLRRGLADVAIVGGVESILQNFMLTALAKSEAFSAGGDDPATLCKPFDRSRSGQVAAEGAAILILETLASAKQRGARIYAELAGYGESHALSDEDAVQERNMTTSMRNALRDAASEPSAVSFVHANGTGSKLGDTREAAAIQQLFGAHASSVCISSSKGASGNMLGAAGAFSTAITALALHKQVVPQTLNLREPEFDLDYVAPAPRARSCKTALSNCFGDSGNHVSIALRAFE